MKVLLTSHGSFCEGILESYNMIAGNNPDIITLKLDNDGIGKFQENLNALVNEIIEKEELLILCDIKGGTPFNESYNLLLTNPDKIRIVTGMNLPMLIEIGVQINCNSLDELYNMALEMGKSGVDYIEVPDDSEEELEF